MFYCSTWRFILVSRVYTYARRPTRVSCGHLVHLLGTSSEISATRPHIVAAVQHHVTHLRKHWNRTTTTKNVQATVQWTMYMTKKYQLQCREKFHQYCRVERSGDSHSLSGSCSLAPFAPDVSPLPWRKCPVWNGGCPACLVACP